MQNTENRFSYVRAGIAAFVGAMLLLGVLFSHIYVTHEYHHNCTGEACPICQTIAECEAFVNQVSTGLIFICASIAVFFAAFITAKIFVSDVISNTLVSYKVRLNN